MRQTAIKIITAAIIVLLLAALSAAITISLSACASHRAAVHSGQSEARAPYSGPSAAMANHNSQNEVKALTATLQISALDWLRLNWNYASVRIIPTATTAPKHSSDNSDYPDSSDSDNSDNSALAQYPSQDSSDNSDNPDSSDSDNSDHHPGLSLRSLTP